MALIKNFRFNLNDLNFILTFAGFPIVTTLLPFIPSVPYRAFALAVALLCLINNKFKFPKGNLFKLFFVILILVDIRVGLDIAFEDAYYTQAKYFCLLFIFGITLIPALAVFSGVEKLNWKSLLCVLIVCLMLMAIKGYFTIQQMVPGEVDTMRMELNDRQSTLALGDNGGYLVILACALISSAKTINRKFLRILAVSVIVVSILAGVFCVAKSGSRGPFLAMIVGLLLMYLTVQAKGKAKIFIVVGFSVLLLGINLDKLSSFAPVLFNRMTATIEEGDLSGRDTLFREAWSIISSHPFTGGNPVIMFPDGSFTTYHNGFLDIGLALGIVGFVVYVFLNLKLLWRACKRYHYVNSPAYFFIIGMLGAFVMRSMSGAGLIANPIYTMCIGLACILLSNNSELLNNVEKH